jgi:hypothetical protein
MSQKQIPHIPLNKITAQQTMILDCLVIQITNYGLDYQNSIRGRE